MMYKALYLSPMIPSYNLPETARFFKEFFEFAPGFETLTYSVLYKDNLSIHLLRAGQDIGEMEFYLSVDDVDTIWDSIKDKLEGIKVRAPFDRDYGMREMHIIIPHTKTLMFLGQAINQ
jgi:hypothetical protein